VRYGLKRLIINHTAKRDLIYRRVYAVFEMGRHLLACIEFLRFQHLSKDHRTLFELENTKPTRSVVWRRRISASRRDHRARPPCLVTRCHLQYNWKLTTEYRASDVTLSLPLTALRPISDGGATVSTSRGAVAAAVGTGTAGQGTSDEGVCSCRSLVAGRWMMQ